VITTPYSDDDIFNMDLSQVENQQTTPQSLRQRLGVQVAAALREPPTQPRRENRFNLTRQPKVVRSLFKKAKANQLMPTCKQEANDDKRPHDRDEPGPSSSATSLAVS
jgi:hypothetical protein